jgi:hypothetical protein
MSTTKESRRKPRVQIRVQTREGDMHPEKPKKLVLSSRKMILDVIVVPFLIVGLNCLRILTALWIRIGGSMSPLCVGFVSSPVMTNSILFKALVANARVFVSL